VAQKRIDYGFVGYQVPTKPRATRSPRVNKFCFSLLLSIYFHDSQNNPCKYFFLFFLFLCFSVEEGYISKKCGTQSNVRD